MSDLMLAMRMTRSVVGVAGLAAGVLFAGCAAGGSEQPPPPPPEETNALADFDPCEVLSQEELAQHGVEEPGEFVDNGIGEPGCDFDSEDFLFTIYKAEGNDMEHWEGNRDKFAEFEPNQVGTHSGIRAVTEGSQESGMCRQIMEAGGGSVSVTTTYDTEMAGISESCSKAMEIAEQVEPKLPE